VAVPERAILNLIEVLPADRGQAFVSAHALAGHLLLMATRNQDRRFVEKAAKVLSRYARGRHHGRCAEAMDRYAKGLVALHAGDDAKAAKELTAALAVMAEEGWTDLAIHAGTECAATWLRMGEAGRATKAMSDVAGTFEGKKIASLVNTWRKLIAARLADAPPEVVAPLEKANEPFRSGQSVGAAGGAGGRGGHAGMISKIGEALPRLPAKKPMLTVARTEEGFVWRQLYDRSFERTVKPKPLLHHTEEGGVTLSFFDQAVALCMVDPEGRRGQPGEGSEPHSLRPFYHLARGETFGVTKQGVVTIKSR
jgi:hypothetical protein